MGTPSGCSSTEGAACLACPSQPSAAIAGERNKEHDSIMAGRREQKRKEGGGKKNIGETTCNLGHLSQAGMKAPK